MHPDQTIHRVTETFNEMVPGSASVCAKARWAGAPDARLPTGRTSLQWQNGHGGQQPPFAAATLVAADAPVVTSAKTALNNTTSFRFIRHPLSSRCWTIPQRRFSVVNPALVFKVKHLDLEVGFKVPY